MPALDSRLRSQLDDVCQKARELAETAARLALQKRAVDLAEPFSHFGPKEKELRVKLRARGRQVGDELCADKTQSIDQLVQELAYEYWHRMLFARFLAENHLLMHPDGVAVSLEECDELAPSADPPAPNGFALAARYASKMLPQIFRTDDVLLEIEFAPEHRLALEKLLAGLPRQTFLADDSLGWVYQFWQTNEKERVNKSGDKIDGTTLPAVTQLFTEHYMVQFLLHNTIGAWWCAKQKIHGPAGGAGVPLDQSPVEMEYLRWRDDGTPAAGAFDGWPRTLVEFTMLDPCCGSGHFLVSAFTLLVPLRMHDDKLSARDACDAVLRENIHGLELDPRCTQIAAFALALAAWKYPGEDGEPLGYRPLPPLHLACSGQGVGGDKEDWLALANGDIELRQQIERLYDMFVPAPHVGSLIDPINLGGPLFKATYAELHPKLAKRLAKFITDVEKVAVGVAAQGIAYAAELLSKRYTLVMTNVPYLGRGKQGDVLKQYIETHFNIAKADLATAFVMRCLQLCMPGGSTALVTPQNWLFLSSYKKLREDLLKRWQWNFVVSLGEEAWWSFGVRGPRTVLLGLTTTSTETYHAFVGIDVSTNRGEPIIPLEEKAERLANCLPTQLQVLPQALQLKNPDSRILLGDVQEGELLDQYATYNKGICTGDDLRFRRSYWEVCDRGAKWSKLQSSVEADMQYGGADSLLQWDAGRGDLIDFIKLRLGGSTGAWIRGEGAWGKRGILIRCMGENPATIYLGDFFDSNTVAIVPNSEDLLLPIWEFMSSPRYKSLVRRINSKLNVGDDSFVKVPFDLAHWQAVAAEKYPNGLPEPHSDDPTQWLFKGDIASSTDPLQVAVARLLGYRWPDQPKQDARVDPHVDDDGIVCLPGVRNERPAAERLFDLLRAVGVKSDLDLEAWLRDKFFEEHCKRFHNRPFIWHIWDGRKDGFSALVNYHKLTHKTLENLTYSYLGDWITMQSKSDKPGADLRLAAAQALQKKLKEILTGEPPYDIFVRWKPLHEQAIGWNPDLNDGVRLNIRPFVMADILRKKPNSIKWTKDRGKEPERPQADYPWFWNDGIFTGDRVNDIHLTTAEKQAARNKMKPKGGKS